MEMLCSFLFLRMEYLICYDNIVLPNFKTNSLSNWLRFQTKPNLTRFIFTAIKDILQGVARE